MFARHRAFNAATVAAMAGVVALLCLRNVAVPVAGNRPARMVQLPGVHADGVQTYFADTSLSDDTGALANISGMRLVADDQGVRVIGLTRLLHGPVHLAADAPISLVPGGVMQRWAEHWQLGYPCWLPPSPCEALPPVSDTDSMAVTTVHRAIHKITAGRLTDDQERTIAKSFVAHIRLADALPFVFAKLNTNPPRLTARQYAVVQAQIAALPPDLNATAAAALADAIDRGQLVIAGARR
jgi:hypothetical protein